MARLAKTQAIKGRDVPKTPQVSAFQRSWGQTLRQDSNSDGWGVSAGEQAAFDAQGM